MYAGVLAAHVRTVAASVPLQRGVCRAASARVGPPNRSVRPPYAPLLCVIRGARIVSIVRRLASIVRESSSCQRGELVVRGCGAADVGR
eukprot:9358656-Pyramimonas_sp.AAC.1